MTQADRPWWATDGDATDRAEDPLDAHRAARRGGAPAGEDVPPDDTTDQERPDGDGTAAGAAAGDEGTWWVPATEAMTRLARDLVTSAAARAADAGGGGTPGGGDGAASDPGAASADAGPGPAADATDAGPAPTHVDACGICPICVGLRAVGDVRPDLVVHLAEAARQLALAVRTVVDAAAPGGAAADPGRSTARSGSPPAGADEMHRIDLDD